MYVGNISSWGLMYTKLTWTGPEYLALVILLIKRVAFDGIQTLKCLQ